MSEGPHDLDEMPEACPRCEHDLDIAGYGDYDYGVCENCGWECVVWFSENHED